MTTAPRSGRAVLTNSPASQEAAAETLKTGGSALDAALAGFFAEAAVAPWALLAPITIVVAGSGSGVRLLDGRARQPGQNVERPVRYSSLAEAPDFALAAVPTTVAAVSLAATMFGMTTLPKLVGPAVRLAKKQGAPERAALISRVGSAKAWAMQDKGFLGEIAERVPRFEGALLQPSELAIERVDVLATELTERLAGVPAMVPPWHDPTRKAPGRLVILVADRGALAGLIVERPSRTVALFDGEVEWPAVASPLLKGVVRVRAGTPVPMTAPLAVVRDASSLMMLGTSADTFDENEIGSLVSLPDAAASLSWSTHEPELRLGLSLAVRASLAAASRSSGRIERASCEDVVGPVDLPARCPVGSRSRPDKKPVATGRSRCPCLIRSARVSRLVSGRTGLDQARPSRGAHTTDRTTRTTRRPRRRAGTTRSTDAAQRATLYCFAYA